MAAAAAHGQGAGTDAHVTGHAPLLCPELVHHLVRTRCVRPKGELDQKKNGEGRFCGRINGQHHWSCSHSSWEVLSHTIDLFLPSHSLMPLHVGAVAMRCLTIMFSKISLSFLSPLQTATRLFDLFLPSHPLMPLYVGAVAMRCVRERLLGCGEMHEAHSLLSKLDFKGDGLPPLEQIIQGALALFVKAPPTALLLGLGRCALCTWVEVAGNAGLCQEAFLDG